MSMCTMDGRVYHAIGGVSLRVSQEIYAMECLVYGIECLVLWDGMSYLLVCCRMQSSRSGVWYWYPFSLYA